MLATVAAGCKVVLVGRTGSGKSSTLAALYRSATITRGSVTIDGIDTATMGLRDLRENLAIVPQDGAVISGTIRSVVSPQGPDPLLGPRSVLSPHSRSTGLAAAGHSGGRIMDAVAGPGAKRLEQGLDWDPDLGRPCAECPSD